VIVRALLTPVLIAMAVAVIVAFVVVVVVRGGDSTATPPATSPPTSSSASPSPSLSSSAPPAKGVRWSTVVPTLSCDGVGTVVDSRVMGDLNGDGRPDAVISAHCNAGAGSPPSVVDVYVAAGAHARLVGTPVRIEDDLLVERVSVRGSEIIVTAQGYTAGTPRCCPDRTIKQTWRVRTTSSGLHLARMH
jgi:hypothetical protein